MAAKVRDTVYSSPSSALEERKAFDEEVVVEESQNRMFSAR